MLEAAIKQNDICFNTKPLKVSDKFVNFLIEDEINPDSWISLSIDSDQTIFSIKFMKWIPRHHCMIIFKNVNRIKAANSKFRKFDISAAYLLNKYNFQSKISKFISDFKNADAIY